MNLARSAMMIVCFLGRVPHLVHGTRKIAACLSDVRLMTSCKLTFVFFLVTWTSPREHVASL